MEQYAAHPLSAPSRPSLTSTVAGYEKHGQAPMEMTARGADALGHDVARTSDATGPDQVVAARWRGPI